MLGHLDRIGHAPVKEGYASAHETVLVQNGPVPEDRPQNQNADGKCVLLLKSNDSAVSVSAQLLSIMLLKLSHL